MKYLLILLIVFFSNSSIANEDVLMKKYNGSLYKIKTIDNLTKARMSYGTGFLVDLDGYLITNYHVISSYVINKEKYTLEFENSLDKSKGDLEVISFDIINDLALLKINTKIDSTNFFNLSKNNIKQGNQLFSFGNPHGIGITIIGGLYNGIHEKSSRGKINFSGNINSGMSGGPVIDKHENLIGVNVQTSGNGMGYLVNAKHVKKLYEDRLNPVSNFKQRISSQVNEWSKKLTNELVVEKDLFNVLQTGIITLDTGNYKCSSSGSDKLWADDNYILNLHSCGANEAIYLDEENSLKGIKTKSIYVYLKKDGKPSKTTLYSTFDDVYYDKNPIFSYSNKESEELICSSDNFIRKNKVILVKTCLSNFKEIDDSYNFTITSLKELTKGSLVFNQLFMSGLSKENSIRLAKLYVEKL
jgi:serine protease Do